MSLIFQVDTLFVHSNFNHSSYINDIAMMKLSDDVEINGFVRPVCLPQDTDNFQMQTCVITGWGAAYSGNIVCSCYVPWFPLSSSNKTSVLIYEIRLSLWKRETLVFLV